jgi:prepilin-type N-terminal cleavage/methylation domain-containing protein
MPQNFRQQSDSGSDVVHHLRAAFTLTEMLIAIAVLLVVIIATSSIFSTAQKVSSLGEANSDILQQANAIERVIRNDFSRISRDGFFAVQCVGVPNNINSNQTGRLLDPTRPEDAEIRSDQLFFFTEGLVASTRALDSYANASNDQVGLDKPAPAQSYYSSVFYSPGVQVKIQPYQDDPTGGALFDVDREELENSGGAGIYPWSYLPGGGIPFQTWPSANGAPSTVPLIPESTENWILCRQVTLLGDDDGSRARSGADLGNTGDYYMSNSTSANYYDPNSTRSIFYDPLGDGSIRFRPDLINSRIDIAATERDTLKQEVCYFWNSSNWGFGGASNQRGNVNFYESPTDLVKTNQVLQAMYFGYPRGELRAPSMQRMDTMLTNAVLGPNVSDFRVEWTWADGVGRDKDVSFNDPDQKLLGGLPGVVVEGVVRHNGDSSIDPFGSTPWFGLSDEVIGSAPASAFMSGANGPEEIGGPTCFGWSHIGDPGRRYTYGNGVGGDAVRIGPPVGTEIGSDPPYFLDDPFGVQTDETLAHIEYGEGAGCAPGQRLRRYGAVFGFNGENAILRKPTGQPYVLDENTPGLGSRIVGSETNDRGVSTYTPWPTAVRISFRLHDSEARLEGGRLFEFIIPLPRADS